MLSFYLVIIFAWFPFFLGRMFKGKLYIYLGVVVLIALSSLRFELGVDYDAYSMIFERYSNNEVVSKTFEPAFVFINKFVIFFGGAFNVTLLIFSAIFIIPIIYRFDGIARRQVHFLVLLFLLDFNSFFTGLSSNRQGAAMGLFFFAIKYIKEKEFVKYLFVMLAASMFHVSALFLIPVYFIVNYFGKKAVLISLFVLNLILIYLSNDILTLLFDYLEMPGYAYFLSRDVSLGLAGGLVLRFFWFMFLVSILDRAKDKVYITVYLIGLLISFWGLGGVNVQRLSMYFSILLPVVFLNIAYLIKEKEIRAFFKVSVVVFFGITLCKTLMFIGSQSDPALVESWSSYKFIIFR